MDIADAAEFRFAVGRRFHVFTGSAGPEKSSMDIAMNGIRKGMERVHKGVIVVVLRNRDVLFVVFLILKSSSDSLGIF